MEDLLNKIFAVQVSDTTIADSSNAVDNKKIKQNKLKDD